jgi:hypothetical protein
MLPWAVRTLVLWPVSLNCEEKKVQNRVEPRIVPVGLKEWNDQLERLRVKPNKISIQLFLIKVSLIDLKNLPTLSPKCPVRLTFCVFSVQFAEVSRFVEDDSPVNQSSTRSALNFEMSLATVLHESSKD